ncbi:hypothetical protein HYPSUDRAFT_426182 [Hypholoma sublateritium FD-334 SS-4]|uniref:Uncharacterized protein n=1 Tax=Hypholoma sublateritium (strain FD-334 SS-4) TaxID=945553 RepID=A0A0D2P9T1_HYPSF|nr:hypothetical protein HYPSUDRAFT_426182 [Hypholoma sublateritium FD-334 SS-4]
MRRRPAPTRCYDVRTDGPPPARGRAMGTAAPAGRQRRSVGGPCSKRTDSASSLAPRGPPHHIHHHRAARRPPHADGGFTTVLLAVPAQVPAQGGADGVFNDGHADGLPPPAPGAQPHRSSSDEDGQEGRLVILVPKESTRPVQCASPSCPAMACSFSPFYRAIFIFWEGQVGLQYERDVATQREYQEPGEST